MQNVEARSAPETTRELGKMTSWGDLFGDDWGGFSTETAMSYSAVYACVKIISETIAMLPREVYKRGSIGKELLSNHYLAQLFASEPNQFQTWYNFIEALVRQALKHGNGYAYIKRNGFGEPVSFRLLPDGQCTIYYDDTRLDPQLYYYVSFFGKMVEPRDIIHITCPGNNGVEGKSPITQARDAIALGLGAGKTMQKVYETNFKSKPVVMVDGVLEEAAFKRLKKELSDSISNDRVILLEDGMKAESLSISPQDAETLATRKFQIEEISRWYRVPLHMLSSLERSTNNNIEHQSKEFVSYCVEPWAIKIAQEFSRKMLMPSQRTTHEVQLDTDYITLNDLKTWSEYIKTLFHTGAMTPDEIRQSRGLNKTNRPEMQKHYVQSQVVTLEMAGRQPPKQQPTQQP